MEKIALRLSILMLAIGIAGCTKVSDSPGTGVTPKPCFTASRSFIGIGDSVVFTNCSELSYYYLWDFGDNSNTSISTNPRHVYTTPGVYTPKLTAYSSDKKLQSTLTGTITVDSSYNLPIPCFTESAANAHIGDSVHFNAQCSRFGIYYSWGFGDGNTSTLETPANVYAATGTYTVTLKVFNGAQSRSATTTRQVTIQ